MLTVISSTIILGILVLINDSIYRKLKSNVPNEKKKYELRIKLIYTLATVQVVIVSIFLFGVIPLALKLL
ncbi:hypothetical protein BpOF4_20544 (plasmid) [Alkalihalophilus pseudofirmus OF4]|uniref:Uncharacterized protein n=1 Tax=Alkalihalophilus pseudofirmus (strain ATCC BAA-2126 / JCM 17055 / OF4) TaxID=398511 RepID=D3G178_ALKPO|nr:hypothetical protein BpOF4_20544 [Alkalihalophilus pseudofirmus OF4]